MSEEAILHTTVMEQGNLADGQYWRPRYRTTAKLSQTHPAMRAIPAEAPHWAAAISAPRDLWSSENLTHKISFKAPRRLRTMQTKASLGVQEAEIWRNKNKIYTY